MSDRLVMSERVYEGIAALGRIGPTRLLQLSEAVNDEQLTTDLEALVKRLADSISVDEATLRDGVRYALLTLSRAREQRRMGSSEFVKLLDTSLREQAEPEWKEAHLPEWEAVQERLIDLLDANAYFAKQNKAIELLYDRPAFLRDVRLLTEVRPLYDEEVTKADGLILTNTLVIEYQEGPDAHRLHLTLDFDDLRKLQAEIGRAFSKSKVIIDDALGRDLKVLTFDDFEAPR